MFVNAERFDAVDWTQRGLIKDTLTRSLLKDGQPIVYYGDLLPENRYEFYLDHWLWEQAASEYEKAYRSLVGWNWYEKWWAVSHGLSDEDLPPSIPNPTVWEEFQQVKGSNTVKRSWMYKKTGKMGLLRELSDGTLYPKHLTSEAYIDYSLHVVKKSFNYSGLIYYNRLYFTTDNPIYTINGREVPLLAIIEDGHECEEHGMYMGSECPQCAANYEVHLYNTDATNFLPFKDEGETSPQYMGIELEYENCLSQKKQVVESLKDHVILKHDGSIRNGFEIVTAPATLAVHKKAFSGFYSKVTLYSLSNCGMHVHVDKRKIGQMQIGKLLAFLYAKDNIPHLEKLAGRSYSRNTYCKATEEKKVTSGFSGRDSFYGKVYRNHGGKYQALNLSPQDTIEFRIFAPPLKEELLFSRLELVQAMLDWTKPAVCSIKDAVSWEKFKDFVLFYKKSYPNLVGVM